MHSKKKIHEKKNADLRKQVRNGHIQTDQIRLHSQKKKTKKTKKKKKKKKKKNEQRRRDYPDLRARFWEEQQLCEWAGVGCSCTQGKLPQRHHFHTRTHRIAILTKKNNKQNTVLGCESMKSARNGLCGREE